MAIKEKFIRLWRRIRSTGRPASECRVNPAVDSFGEGIDSALTPSNQSIEAFAPISCRHWYEVDPGRLEIEVNAMAERGFIAGQLVDGRLCFVKRERRGNGYNVAIICDYQYPLKPPDVYVEGESEELPLPRKADGTVNVLTTAKTWTPDLAAVTVVDYLEEIIALFKQFRQSMEQTGTSFTWPDELDATYPEC